jgi:receptor expression-enhancing protein 5/6
MASSSLSTYLAIAQSYASPFADRIDSWFADNSLFTDLACRANVPRKFLTSGVVVAAFLFFVFGAGAGLVSVIVGTVWPAYCSMRALETEGKEDDVQWCGRTCAARDPVLKML